MRRRSFAIFKGALLAILCLLIAAVFTLRPSSEIVISRETTFILGPLSRAGHVDFLAGVLKREGNAVHLKDNAAIPLLAATCSSKEEADSCSIIFEYFGLIPPEPSEGGLTEVARTEAIVRWLREQDIYGCSAKEIAAKSMRRPWAASTYPPLAAWIEKRASDFDRLSEISVESPFFGPEPRLLDDANFPLVLPGEFWAERIWQAAKSLATRAMYRVGSRNYITAWDDVQTLFALSSLQGCHQDGDLTTRLKVHRLALHGTLVIATSCDGDNALLQRIDDFLTKVPSCRELVPGLLWYERVATLDAAQRIILGAEIPRDERDRYYLFEAIRREGLDSLPFDGNTMLRQINNWFDRIDLAMQTSPASRNLPDSKLLALLDDLPDSHSEPIRLEEFQTLSRHERGGALANMVLGYRGFDRLVASRPLIDGMEVHRHLVRVAIALERYRSGHGAYPKSLESLGASHGKMFVADPYSMNDLKYALRGQGYLLYSVFINLKDDGGYGGDPLTGLIINGEWTHTGEYAEVGKDLVIRVPVPVDDGCGKG